jgi:hypothetical protein
MENLEKMIYLLQNYEADLRDGFVSNTESYVEHKCIELNIFELKDDITKLIIKSICL